MTSEIWLADLARAFADVRPETDADVRAIARLLGFTAPLGQDPAAGLIPRPSAEDVPLPDQWDDTDTDDAGEAGAAATTRPAPDDLPLLQPVARHPVRATGWGVKSLPRASGQLEAAPDRVPLLPPRGTATILQTLVATKTAEGPLDVPAIVESLARREVPRRLPRYAWPTLRFGVLVLADLALPMRPFEGDQLQVIAGLRAIAGPRRTTVSYFADVPTRGAGAGPRRTWRPLVMPERGTRVLVLSDFGLGGPPWYAHRGRPDEWRSFVGDLRRHGCDAVALLPVAADRWPAWLSALMPLVSWDRTTSIGKVVAALGGR
jgi:hypothetical protein